MTRYRTKTIYIRDIPIGGDSPISIQSMTFSKTADINSTLEQINRLYFAGCQIVRVAVSDEDDANALEELVKKSPLPVVADIHFRYKLALIAAKSVDCIRINPGNIGSKDRIKEVAKACSERNIPIRIGVNGGSLEEQFEKRYGYGAEAMVQSALYNIKLLEDIGFTNLKVSLKSSDVPTTVEAYRGLRPLVDYPFHLGVTEAGTIKSATIKSAIGLGALLVDGIGDTLRVSITGELEAEIEVAKDILKATGRIKEGVNLISCPTCGRLEADLVSAVKDVEDRVKHIKKPLNISVMGCAVNAIGEAKHADLAIAFGKKDGLIIKKGKVVCKLKESELLGVFEKELEELVKEQL
ncbi:MAG: flavodoxin-dependent (E)-4-hydroxy-3-methylbut-2-enyl-diphosphate synthase [Campylobacterales bacterium]